MCQCCGAEADREAHAQLVDTGEWSAVPVLVRELGPRSQPQLQQTQPGRLIEHRPHGRSMTWSDHVTCSCSTSPDFAAACRRSFARSIPRLSPTWRNNPCPAVFQAAGSRPRAKSDMARSSLLGRTLRIARGSAGCRRAFSSRDGIAGFLDELATRRVVHDTTHPLASMANQLQ